MPEDLKLRRGRGEGEIKQKGVEKKEGRKKQWEEKERGKI